MIKKIQTRDRGMDGGGYEHFDMPTLEFDDPLDAVAHMAEIELSFSAQILDISKTSIALEVNFMNCIVKSTFEGSSEEMRPLIECVAYYLKAFEVHCDVIVDFCAKQAPSNPLLCSLITPLLLDSSSLKISVMLACGLSSKDDIMYCLKQETKVEDIVAAIQLQNEGLCTFREALHL